MIFFLIRSSTCMDVTPNNKKTCMACLRLTYSDKTLILKSFIHHSSPEL